MLSDDIVTKRGNDMLSVDIVTKYEGDVAKVAAVYLKYLPDCSFGEWVETVESAVNPIFYDYLSKCVDRHIPWKESIRTWRNIVKGACFDAEKER